MKKSWLLIVVVAAVLLWLGLRSRHSPHPTAELKPAPDFSLRDLSGHTLSLSEYRGKVVLLDFWATWCEPCKTEIPHFIDMQNRFGGQGLQVIGVSMDDEEKPVRDFQQQYKMNYPVVLGNPKMAQSYGGVLGLPITFVIDREGRIQSRHIGQTQASVFESEVQKLIKE